MKFSYIKMFVVDILVYYIRLYIGMLFHYVDSIILFIFHA